LGDCLCSNACSALLPLSTTRCLYGCTLTHRPMSFALPLIFRRVPPLTPSYPICACSSSLSYCPSPFTGTLAFLSTFTLSLCSPLVRSRRYLPAWPIAEEGILPLRPSRDYFARRFTRYASCDNVSDHLCFRGPYG